jgi:hypothetical protein
VITPAMRELLAIAAATADVPYPASSDAMGAYRRIMADRLGSLRAILGKLSEDPDDWNASQIRGQAGLLREWLEKSPVTYEPYVPAAKAEG